MNRSLDNRRVCWMWVWLAIWACAGSFFFWRGVNANHSQMSVAATPVSSVDSGPREEVPWLTKSIEQVRVGDRVRVDLPAHLQEAAIGSLADVPDWDRLNSQIDPADWRTIHLTMEGTEGDFYEITLLRPLTWIDSSGAAAGSTIHLVVAEQGLDGLADVLRVEPSPPIQVGAGRIVTGTFTHVRGDILCLKLEGIVELLSVTFNHSMYSADRDAFLPAGEIRIGEKLRHLNGFARVERIDDVSGEEQVYNLEIHGAHVYHVTSAGILVHNASSRISNVPGDDFVPNPDVDTPYSRPSGAGPTAAQRAAVQGKPCVECGKVTPRQVADHIEPLSVEHYRTGTNDIAHQSSVEAVQPHCPECSASQGGYLSAFSRRMKSLLGL